MALSIKTKQVLGVTLIVGLAVLLLSAWYISTLATVQLQETRARADFLFKAITHRAFDVVQAGGDPLASLQDDTGLRSILQSSLYAPNVEYAAIVDADGIVVAHSDDTQKGRTLNAVEDLEALLEVGPVAQAQAIYRSGGKSYEYRKPLLLGAPELGPVTELGSVRIGVSTILLRDELYDQMRAPLVTTALAIVIALGFSLFFAQITLRPIHVIQSGLARLGRGELDVTVDLPGDAELAGLGDSFKAVSDRLERDRSELAGQRAALDSVIESTEEGLAIFSPDGTLISTNPSMEAQLGGAVGQPIDALWPAGHPYRVAFELALTERDQAASWRTVDVPDVGERKVASQPIEDPEGRLLSIIVRVRDITEFSRLGTMLQYSQKLAALSRLTAGIAHEVKNPLNATMIHLELLKMQMAESPAALEHLAVIATQVRRLDEVVQGFLKFTRPEDLQLQPVSIPALVEEIVPIVAAEASKSGVEIRLEFPNDLPLANADRGMLQQAFLNLALNAAQAMPRGGRLRIAAFASAHDMISVVFQDTGVGIPPENLSRIFDLYFTTRQHGSGIGLSLVYRTVQMLDGEIKVESVPGHGTTFTVLLRQAPVPSRRQATAAGGTLGLHEVEHAQ